MTTATFYLHASASKRLLLAVEDFNTRHLEDPIVLQADQVDADDFHSVTLRFQQLKDAFWLGAVYGSFA